MTEITKREIKKKIKKIEPLNTKKSDIGIINKEIKSLFLSSFDIICFQF